MSRTALRTRSTPLIRWEGSLLGPDIADALLKAELPGQQPHDFSQHFHTPTDLLNDMVSTFTQARQFWTIFKSRLEQPDAPTRLSATHAAQLWIGPFLSLLGYELHPNPEPFLVGETLFRISHRAGPSEEAPPIHIVSPFQELGKVDPHARPRYSPHVLLQEFLNRTEHVWGIVTNGRYLRLLRDSTYIRRQSYVEFDLAGMLEEERFEAFEVLYRLLHISRLPASLAKAEECYLEQYYEHAVRQGGRVRSRLRRNVEEALRILGNGFLSYPGNTRLRQQVRAWLKGEPSDGAPLSAEALYRELLRLVYRFLFLLVAEERGLMSDHPLYRLPYGYGLERLRRLVLSRRARSDHTDLWQGLRVLWKALSDESLGQFLKLPPLNGDLFRPQVLDGYLITNRALLEAVWHLVYFYDAGSGGVRRISYSVLDVEELGSVYEGLLEYEAQVVEEGGRLRFELGGGGERKSTGSYYTPHELVVELVRRTLDPVIEERLRRAGPSKAAQEAALLGIRVLDPACGSGHFLLEAGRRIGRALARLRTGEENPAPEALRQGIRDAITHCLYGVDKNPLAIELCRLALWIEGHASDKPLTFLEHRICVGDSLVGVLNPNHPLKGLPDDAFEALSTEDKKLAAALKKRNRQERTGQTLSLFHAEGAGRPAFQTLGAYVREIEAVPDDRPEHIRQKAERYRAYQNDEAYQHLKRVYDLWTAGFLQRVHRGAEDRLITSEAIGRALARLPVDARVQGHAETLAHQHPFLHWPLAFPEVFQKGGFDVILSNPPWERIKLQEEEFFARLVGKHPLAGAIVKAPNAAVRKQLIATLPQADPGLWNAYQEALHRAEALSRFLRGSGAYPLTGRGDINTYSVFAERIRNLLGPHGRAGLILPTGIATDATNQHLFASLLESHQILFLYDFENKEGIFPEVHKSYKFALVGLAGREVKRDQPPQFCFFATRPDHLYETERVFSLSPAEIARVNPNTRTLPIFRTRQDAELTLALYDRAAILLEEPTGHNPWQVRFLSMFHMANDSPLFRMGADLERAGYQRVGNSYQRAADSPSAPAEPLYLPLYEAKMIWLYHHRYGTYDRVKSRSSTELPIPSEEQLADPTFLAQPWYWVPATEVQHALAAWKRPWMIGCRKITNATNERTAVVTLLPRVGVGDSMNLLLPEVGALKASLLLGNLSSLPFDWVVRQKLGGVNLNLFYLKQLPVLLPEAYGAEAVAYVVPRVVELVYTAWDVKGFVDEVWGEAGPELRAAMEARWKESWGETEAPAMEPPEWVAFYGGQVEGGCPLPPFRWEPERRAIVQAELDAFFAWLYGLNRKQLRYILDPADLTPHELKTLMSPTEEVADPLDDAAYQARTQKSAFPGESFRVLKEKEKQAYGEYRTRRRILEAWARLLG